MIIAQIVVVSWVYTYLQTHQVVDIKYVQLSVCQSYLSKEIPYSSLVCTYPGIGERK